MFKKLFKYDKNFYNKYEKESLKKIQISLIVILCFILLSVILFTDSDLKVTYFSITLLGFGVVFFSIYLSQKDEFDKSVFALIVLTLFLSWSSYFFDPSIKNGDFIPIFYLVVPILLASVFVNTKRTVSVAAIQIIAAFIMISSSKQLQNQNWISYVIFFILIVSITMVSKYMYNKEISENLEKSKRLNKLNSELENLNQNLTKSKEEIERAAYYDSLTDLGNALKLKNDIKKYIELNRKFIAIQFNISNFRSINEIYGYKIGDDILKEVTNILAKYVSKDNIYRWSADEFIIIKLDDEFNVRIFNFLNDIEREFKEQIKVNNEKMNINFSCGVVSVPEDVNEYEDLLLYLNLTTEKAKEKRDEKWELFNDTISIELLEKNHIKETILTSLADNTFYFEGQSVFEIENKNVLFTELLLRTTTKYQNSINSLINLAEKSNYIIDIDMWVLRNAFIHLNKNENWDNFNKISINISPQTFQSQSFVKTIEDLVTEYKVDPNRICFEITEYTAFMDQDQALNTMKKLKQRGFEIALDDFGVMYSSMSYLVELPYDYVKIDRGFVEDIGKNVKKRSLVKSLLTLAKDLNIIVIAEGVNNELELRELEMLGVKYIQGFYFQRPYKI